MPDRAGANAHPNQAATETQGLRHLWRISNYSTLEGAGGLRASARWHTAGRRIVDLAESPAGALIEALAHLELHPAALPSHYTLLQITAPEHLCIHSLEPVPFDLSLDLCRELGDQWLAEGQTALLRVPSLILPHTFNLLLNPIHPEAAQVQIAARAAYPWDSRLLRPGTQ